jgi:hypothetical protein
MRRLLYVTPGVAILLALLAPALFAKPSGITLAELVQQSSAIVRGRLNVEGGAVPKLGTGWAAFEASQILKGNGSLANGPIKLCNSPPTMREYPDPTRWVGREVVLFLSAAKEGCFEYSHTTTSVLAVDKGKVTTAAIADEPIDQPWSVFVKKLRKLMTRGSGKGAPVS